MTIDFFKKLVKDLALLYIKNTAVKQLLEYAKTPNPDIQFSLPIVGYECDIWVTLTDAKPSQKAEFLMKTTVNGIVFYVFWEWKKKGSGLLAQNESNETAIA
ncbi:hypothetical protein GG496_000198 [Candidatus Fervidibacteria bacterium JGI MDM2 JNZ-1-D12]